MRASNTLFKHAWEGDERGREGRRGLDLHCAMLRLFVRPSHVWDFSMTNKISFI